MRCQLAINNIFLLQNFQGILFATMKDMMLISCNIVDNKKIKISNFNHRELNAYSSNDLIQENGRLRSKDDVVDI